MKYSFQTTKYERDITTHSEVMSHGAGKCSCHEHFWKQNGKYMFYVSTSYLGANTFKHHSRITLAHVHVNTYLTFTHRNGTKPGSNTIMTDKHAAEHTKTACLALTYLCVIYRLTLQQYSQKYPSLDKDVIFKLQVNFHTSNGEPFTNCSPIRLQNVHLNCDIQRP